MPKRSKKSLRDKLSEVVHEIILNGKTRWVCQANKDGESPCGHYQEKTFNPGNFKRHILTKHERIAVGLELNDNEEDNESLEPTPKKVQPDKIISKLTINVTPAQVLLGTLMMVTKNGLPLSFPEWEATEFTLKPLWDAAKLTVTRNTLPDLIKRAAQNMREIMSSELKNKIINLKIDAASRNGRSVLGINAQFTDDEGAVKIRHIAVHEMNERQTKENLQSVIEMELQKIAVLWAQILAIAHDNGANMCACVRLINSILRKLMGFEFPQRSLIEPSPELEEDEDDEEEEETGIDETDESNDAEIVDDFCEGVTDFEQDEITNEEEMVMFDTVQSIRCSAHTAQLAVWDVLTPYKPRLQKINKICIKMRHKEFRQLFTGYKVPLPPKVVETRWNVWFVVLSYLKELTTSPVYPVLLAQDATLDLSKHSSFIEKFIEAFEPMFQLTNRLQKDHIPLTDFYSLWLVCQGHESTIASSGNVLAKKLLAAMEKRILMLTKTSLFKACLLLDPRFNFKGANRLTGPDKVEAKRYLLSLNRKLDELNGNPSKEDDVNVANPQETNPPTHVSALIESYVTGLFDEDVASPSTSTKSESPIDILNQLECRNKVLITTMPWTVNGQPTYTGPPFNIIEYWKKQRVHNPFCYRLAMILYSAPSTQVTVERLFSHLKFILTDSRNKLSSVTVQDIMLLRMNKDLLPQAVEMLLKQLKR